MNYELPAATDARNSNFVGSEDVFATHQKMLDKAREDLGLPANPMNNNGSQNDDFGHDANSFGFGNSAGSQDHLNSGFDGGNDNNQNMHYNPYNVNDPNQNLEDEYSDSNEEDYCDETNMMKHYYQQLNLSKWDNNNALRKFLKKKSNVVKFLIGLTVAWLILLYACCRCFCCSFSGDTLEFEITGPMELEMNREAKIGTQQILCKDPVVAFARVDKTGFLQDSAGVFSSLFGSNGPVNSNTSFSKGKAIVRTTDYLQLVDMEFTSLYVTGVLEIEATKAELATKLAATGVSGAFQRVRDAFTFFGSSTADKNGSHIQLLANQGQADLPQYSPMTKTYQNYNFHVVVDGMKKLTKDPNTKLGANCDLDIKEIHIDGTFAGVFNSVSMFKSLILGKVEEEVCLMIDDQIMPVIPGFLRNKVN